MGLALVSYAVLALTGGWLSYTRQTQQVRLGGLRSLHVFTGVSLVLLVLLLLGIGVVGTWGHYGSLGHSSHLSAGLVTVTLVLLSATTATQIPQKYWARPVHITLNIILFIILAWVSYTGWEVVQKYLP